MRLRLAWLLWIGMAGCGESGGVGGTYVTRDSAGIRIVEVDVPAAPAQRWVVSPSPVVEFGLKAPANAVLYFVRGAVRLSNEEVVIANGGAHQLHWYDASGELLRTVGREGAGPGEFGQLNWIARHGADSVLVLGGRARRLSVFDPGGTFVRSVPVAARGDYWGTFADGSPLLGQDRYGGEGFVRQDVVLWKLSVADGSADSLGTYGGDEQIIGRDGNMFFILSAPFGRQGVFAVSGARYLVADQEQYEISEYTSDGGLARLFRIRQTPATVTSVDIDRFREGSIAAYEGSDLEAWQRRLDEQPYPDVFPTHGAMMVDKLGQLWLQAFPKPWDELVEWWVFDPEGRPIGTVTLPTAFEAYEIGEDYLLGKWADSLDVEHVGMYGLSKP
jgi:hypothetical protein